jgi:selenocysteine-specific elongation factor
MPLTVGTAGHIDHGKTWLVRALTGKDTDRLPEEQARGISIDLGYAPLELPDGRRLSLVDVPGHERFVRTMVAGATGIDLFLLVIDAGEGARPQTHEHLAILRLLGVDRGVVAVTKADAVDAETLELALAEAHELVPNADVVAVSAKTGAGLDELRAALARSASESTRAEAPTRLYVDRVFTLRGIGTVATGTLWSGRIAAGDVLRVEPAGREVRVRSVQVHDEAVDVAEAGQRVAVALPGLERQQLGRGDVLVEPGAYGSSYRLDVELEELAPIPPRVLVHHGTSATLARVVRNGGHAQLRLAAPVVAARGDRVVLRAGTTVGGGRVIDPAPPRHADARRFERSARGEVIVHAPVRGDDGRWTYSEEWLAELRAELGERLDRADPLDPGVAAPTEPWAAEVVPLLGLERRGAKLYRPGASGSLGSRDREAAELEASLGATPVKVEDARLARFLEERGRLVRVGDGYAISPSAYEHARETLLRELERAERITLARFRDLLDTSRKTAQLLLERFDADGLTRRIGDERVLRRTRDSGAGRLSRS